MPSQDWIDAASAANRSPVLWMRIQSVNALVQSIDTVEQWQQSTSVSNLNMLSPDNNVGSVILTTNGTEANAGIFFNQAITRTSYPVNQGSPAALTPSGDRTVGGIFNFTLLDGDGSVAIWATNADTGITTPVTNAPFVGNSTQNVVLAGLTPGRWQFFYAVYPAEAFSWNSFTSSYQTSYAANGYLRTTSIDLGSVPTANSIVSIGEQVVVDECSLTFELYGSNDNASWVDMGEVSDGSSVAPFRYYQFGCTFVSTVAGQGVPTGTPILASVGISGGNSQFLDFSTHPDFPVPGALPYLLPDIGTLGSTLTLMNLGTTGEISPNLYYLPATFNMLQTGYLRNKTVQLLYGFEGLSAGDFTPIFTGLWYDGVLDLVKSLINVKTRTVFSIFQKVQFPREKALDGLRDSITCPPWNLINVNIISAMLSCLDMMGIAERYVPRSEFIALQDGPFAGDDWNVSRRIDKDNKIEATKLLEELSVLSGVFLRQMPDGTISPMQYNPGAPQVCQLSPDIATFGQVSLGQSELYTRQQMLFTPKHVNDLDVGVARGSWADGSSYLIGMCIIDTLTSIAYHCYLQNNSTDDNQPGYGSGWRSFWFARWAAGAAYSASAPALLTDPENIIVHNKTVYTCIQNVPASLTMEPGITSGWASYWSVGATITVDGTPIVNPWSAGSTANLLQVGETLSSPLIDPWLWGPNMDFSRADTIFNHGILYRCLQNHNSGSGSAGSNILEPGVSTGISRKSFWATEWLPGVNYVNGDWITCQGPLFQCFANHVSSTDNKPMTGLNCQTYWYWSPTKDGSSPQDFYNAYILINNQAEINWGLNADVPPGDPSYQVNPGYQKNWYDMWNATPAALVALAARMDSWFANPLMKVKVSNLPPSFYQYPLGSMVGVSGLMLPSDGAVWGTPCSRKQFMIMNTTLDPKGCKVAFDLMEAPPVIFVTGLIEPIIHGAIVIQALELVIPGHGLTEGASVTVFGVASAINGIQAIHVVDVNTVAINNLNYSLGDSSDWAWSGSGAVAPLTT